VRNVVKESLPASHKGENEVKRASQPLLRRVKKEEKRLILASQKGPERRNMRHYSLPDGSRRRRYVPF